MIPAIHVEETENAAPLALWPERLHLPREHAQARTGGGTYNDRSGKWVVNSLNFEWIFETCDVSQNPLQSK